MVDFNLQESTIHVENIFHLKCIYSMYKVTQIYLLFVLSILRINVFSHFIQMEITLPK